MHLPPSHQSVNEHETHGRMCMSILQKNKSDQLVALLKGHMHRQRKIDVLVCAGSRKLASTNTGNLMVVVSLRWTGDGDGDGDGGNF